MEIYIFINCLWCTHAADDLKKNESKKKKTSTIQLNACILVKLPINIVQITIFGEGEANQGPFFFSFLGWNENSYRSVASNLPIP